jgi:hypothetical protein
MVRYVAEFQVAVHLAVLVRVRTIVPKPRLSNGSDFSQMQDDGAMERRSRNNQATFAQRLTLAAGNDSSVAVHDSNASEVPSVEREAQCV